MSRNPRSWLAFRMALGICGAALVVLPLGLWNAWLWSIGGVAMFFVAVLLPPARPVTTIEDKERELGSPAQVSGEMQPDGGHRDAGPEKPKRRAAGA